MRTKQHHNTEDVSDTVFCKRNDAVFAVVGAFAVAAFAVSAGGDKEEEEEEEEDAASFSSVVAVAVAAFVFAATYIQTHT